MGMGRIRQTVPQIWVPLLSALRTDTHTKRRTHPWYVGTVSV